MKKIFTVLLFICFLPGTAQNNSKQHAEQAFMLVKVLEKYHYQPPPFNDELSGKLWTNFIVGLDPDGLFFTQTEINELKQWDKNLDDDIISKSTAFLEKATALYRKKLILADTIIGEILSKPTDFSTADTMHFSKKQMSPNYTVDEKGLRKRWNKWLKYQLLTHLFSPTDEHDDPFLKDVNVLFKKEPEARMKVLNNNKRMIKRTLDAYEGFENYVAAIYLNALVACYDPHSSFFSASDKQDFVSSVSADALSFGIYFDENENGEIEIVQLIPGGSAWKSGKLNKGDILLKIKPAGSKSIDLSYSSADEAMQFVKSVTATGADFTVRKANGQITSITLVKSKLRSDENVVKSYILKGEKKIGYISLPSFYTEWENNNPLGCANDVAKEIVKLQEENIDGLVLDLRYNGGGSVREAIGLAGIFIDEGPLCIYKTRHEKPYLLKDMNRGTAYNGPLVIMVNGPSASASELFSAAVQDYKRAVIVGSPTFGKATGQIIIPIDTSYTLQQIMLGGPPKKDNKLGFIKITTEKFYRVTNATHQKKGVIPDIHLPEPFYYSDYKEDSYPNALSNDSILKKIVYSPLTPIPVKTLADKSSERLQKNKNFIRLQQVNDSLQMIRNLEKPLALNPAYFKTGEKDLYRLSESMSATMTDSSQLFTTVNNFYDQQIMNIDEFSKDINDIFLQNIQKDIYIEEVYSILSDLITFGKN